MNSTTMTTKQTKKVAEAIAADPISVAREEASQALATLTTARGEHARAQKLAAEARAAAVADPSRRDQFVNAQADETLAGDRMKGAEAEQLKAEARLARLIQERKEQEHAAGLVRAASWPDQLRLTLAKLDALDIERASLVDQIADGVLRAQSDYDSIAELESELQPLVGLRERMIDRPTMGMAFYLARVFLAHSRSAAGRDALPDQLVAEPIPEWNDPRRATFERASSALGINAKEGAK